MGISVMCDVVALGRVRGESIDSTGFLRACEIVKKQLLALETKKARLQGATAKNSIQDSMWYVNKDPRELWAELENRIIELNHS